MIDLFKPNLLLNHISNLHDTSLDDSDKANLQYMTSSTFSAICFDDVKDEYVLSRFPTIKPNVRSNDALVIIDQSVGKFLFIEFKNGVISGSKKKLELEKIRSKIAESLLILNDILKENLNFDQTNVNFILVYNRTKNPTFEQNRKSSFTAIAASIAAMAKMDYQIEDFNRYKAFFHNVKTINEIEFQSIVNDLQNGTYIF